MDPMRTQIRIAVLAAVVALQVTPACAEDVRATFLGEMTYTQADKCDKAKQEAAAGKTPDAVILNARGVGDSEFDCGVSSVEEREPGRVWAVRMACVDIDFEEWDETDVFEKNGDGSFKITIEGSKEPEVFVPCYLSPKK